MSPNSHPAQNPVLHMQNHMNATLRYARKSQQSNHYRVSQGRLEITPTAVTPYPQASGIHTQLNGSQVEIDLARGESQGSPVVSAGSERPNLPPIRDKQLSKDTDGLVIDPIPVEISDDEHSTHGARRADGLDSNFNTTGVSHPRTKPMKLGDAQILWAVDGIDKFGRKRQSAQNSPIVRIPEAERDRYLANRTTQ